MILKMIIPMTLLLCHIIAGHVMAQGAISDQPSLTQVTPGAPNAAALGKFGDIPVGLATGIPEIHVPLYSFQNVDHSLGLDINLDYHAGGIKVDEMATDVGIGWVLNAGGAVTRTRRGIQDEASIYGFMNSPSILDELTGNNCYNNYYPNYFGSIANNNYDGQNDIFSFNLGGRTGKFMYGKNGDFLMLTSNKLKVQNVIDSNEIRSFTVIDEKGTRYVFDAIEHSDDGTAASYHIYASAWYLTKIISPFSTDSITLEYEEEYCRYTAGKFVTRLYSMGVIPPPKSQQVSYTTVVTTGKRLKKINLPNGIAVNFIYDTALRTDQVSTSSLYRLNQIGITDGVTTRGYNLYHDYSTNRLTLNKVVPYNAAGETPGFEFSYNSALPPMLSNEQDHWGYYNTNASGDMIPKYYDKIRDLTLSGGTRSTDPNRVKAGSLARMKYPTGGYTDFEMEANTAEDPRLVDTFFTIIKQKDFSSGVYVATNTPATYPFSFNGDAGSTLSCNANIFQDGNCISGSSCGFYVQLKNSSGSVLYTKTITSDGSLQYKDYPFTITNMQPGNYSWYVYVQNMNYTNYLNLSWTELHNSHPDTTKTFVKDWYVGGLRVKSVKDYDGVHAWPVEAKTYDYVQKDGIKSSGTLGVLPVYEYPVYYDFIRGESSTGQELLPVNNNYKGYNLTNCIVRVSSPTQSLATINGTPVTYSRVVENYLNNGQSNGKKECFFRSYPTGELTGFNAFPFIPPTYADFTYGQLEREVVYNNNNDSIKTTVNDYQTIFDGYFNNTSRLINFTSVALTPVVFAYKDNAGFTSWSQVVRPIYYASRTFTPAAGRKDIIKTTVTNYAGGITSSQQTNVVYDTAFNVKTLFTYNSTGEKIETVKYYPYEYTTTVANDMKARNMYAPEISTEIWKTIGSNRYLVNGLVNQYNTVPSGIRRTGIAQFGSSTSVLSTSLGAFNTASFNRDVNVFKDFISFGYHPTKGFISDQSKINDMQHSYLYGYNGNWVIAEGRNAASSEIAFSSFEEDGKGNWSYTGATVADAAALTGSKVYNLQNGAIIRSGLTPTKSFIVSYWSKGTAATVSGTTFKQGRTVNGWTYFEHLVPAGTTAITVQGSAVIDELMLYPSDATLVTYTYNLLFGMTSMCTENGIYNYFQYDGFGRLKTITDQSRKVLKIFDYQAQAPITK